MSCLLDVAFVPFRNLTPSPSEDGVNSQKEYKCLSLRRVRSPTHALRENTHGGCLALTHLARFLLSSGTSFSTDPSSSPLLRKKTIWASAPLCSCSGAPTRRSSFGCRSSRHKKTEKPQKWQSRDLPTNLRPLAWVCCPLIGSSLRLDV
jgi:hypothetical protein